jgi:hypothetical protein
MHTMASMISTGQTNRIHVPYPTANLKHTFTLPSP